MVRVRRVYEAPSPDDGRRVLVDRLWPRGMRREDLALDAWLKEIAPSTELRKAYHAGKLDFPAFRERYLREIESAPEASDVIRDLSGRLMAGPVTLLTASRSDPNHATILAEILTERAEWPNGAKTRG